MMDFVEGIRVDDILQNPDARIMRQDISERAIEVVLRQMIDFSLQLQKLDFPHFGSLTSKVHRRRRWLRRFIRGL